MLAKFKTKSFENFLTNLSPKDESLWRATKNISKTKSANVPIKKPDGYYAISDANKSELFKQHLTDIFQPHADILCPQTMSTVEEFLNSPHPVSLQSH